MNSPMFDNFSEALFHWAKVTPNKTCLIDLSDNKKYSYVSFDAKVNSATRLLQGQELQKGDIVAIRVRNSADFLILYFACIRGGFVVNPYPVSTSDDELAKSLKFIRPRLVIVEKGAEELPRVIKKITLTRSGPGSLTHLVKKFPTASVHDPIDRKKSASLYLSSGTTGNPKAMLFSHVNIIERSAAVCTDFGHTHDTVHFGFLPMGHTSITDYSFLPVIYVGGTLVIAENFISIQKDFWKIVKKYRVRYVQTVPTVLFSILNIPYRGYSRKGVLLPYIACGSAPLPLSTQTDFKKKFGVPVANLYGCSETGPAFLDDPTTKQWKPGSIGFPLKAHTCILLTEKKHEAKRGSVGEIAIKSKTVCIGYHKNPMAYRKAMWKGFFLTGDLAYRDRHGRYYYTDRKKDLIIKGGSNIFPGEIDEVLFKHPAVTEACTIGIPDALYGENIVTFVVLKKDAEVEELYAHCSKHLQPLKQPKRIIVVSSIPKTYSGKLLRRKLRLLYEEHYTSLAVDTK